MQISFTLESEADSEANNDEPHPCLSTFVRLSQQKFHFCSYHNNDIGH
jgi:hypothetical protein